MKKTFSYGIASSQGSWPAQEDGYFVDPQRGIFAISDGFGGRGAGDMAAKIAIDQVKAFRSKQDEMASSLSLLQKEIFEKAHRAILERNKDKRPSNRGGSSLVSVSIQDTFLGSTRARFFQCGACSAFLLRGGRLRPLLLPQGVPREDFLPALPDQGLGLGENFVVESRDFFLLSGDMVGIVSSGVDWEREDFQMNLFSLLAVRAPGEDLSALASQTLQSSSLASQSWNRTLLLVEKV